MNVNDGTARRQNEGAARNERVRSTSRAQTIVVTSDGILIIWRTHWQGSNSHSRQLTLESRDFASFMTFIMPFQDDFSVEVLPICAYCDCGQICSCLLEHEKPELRGSQVAHSSVVIY